MEVKSLSNIQSKSLGNIHNTGFIKKDIPINNLNKNNSLPVKELEGDYFKLREELKEKDSLDNINKILEKSAVLGVLGLGYVGLPLAVEKAKAGFRTIGFDDYHLLQSRIEEE